MARPTITYYKSYHILFALLLLAVLLFFFDQRSRDQRFTFAVLDVGQGDALYIESPTGTQVLIDGGPPRKILGKLAEVIPAYDRTLDALILTHSDADHISGFQDILSFYKVGQVFEPGVVTDSEIYENFKNELKEKNIPSVIARAGTRLHLGGGVVIDIIFPDRDVYDWETNMASVVAKLSYKEETFMLMGDAPIETEEMILENLPSESLRSKYLKIGHHGSRTSTSRALLDAVLPEYAFISSGRDNRFGHPHPEVLEFLGEIKILRTDESGTIMFKSDGQNHAFTFYK